MHTLIIYYCWLGVSCVEYRCDNVDARSMSLDVKVLFGNC